METITLQIKRVTKNWDKNKSYKPKPGEIVLIALEDNEGFDIYKTTLDNGIERSIKGGTHTRPLLIVGDKEHNLDGLILTSKYYVDCYNIKDISKKVVATHIESSSQPSNISSESSIGSLTTFARADHQHKLERTEAETILGTNNDITQFNCRRIKAGTSIPSDTDGDIGDIFILYE